MIAQQKIFESLLLGGQIYCPHPDETVEPEPKEGEMKSRTHDAVVVVAVIVSGQAIGKPSNSFNHDASSIHPSSAVEPPVNACNPSTLPFNRM